MVAYFITLKRDSPILKTRMACINLLDRYSQHVLRFGCNAVMVLLGLTHERIYMNHAYLNALCAHFSLGAPKQAPQRVYGGLLHIMWRIDTDKGSYAIKQLSKTIDLTNPCVVERYETSEQTAAHCAKYDIPAVVALEKNGKHLFVTQGTGFLVYPWVEAKALKPHAVSEYHALKVAEMLAKMHRLTIPKPASTQPEPLGYAKEDVVSLIDALERSGSAVVQSVQKNVHHLLDAHDVYHRAIPTLKEHGVVSHGDLDQKNVLWDAKGNPVLVDWESACTINPTYDIINTALAWSGIGSNFDKKLFLRMITTYQKAGGLLNKDHLKAALNGTLSMLGWLMYNIERSSTNNESEDKTVGTEQVSHTLATILKLRSLIPDLLESLVDVIDELIA